MKIYCATGNQGKLREFQLAAQLENIEVETIPGLDAIPAPEETGLTFEANAALKACYYSTQAEGLVFCDDSGIEVDALGGAPGVYSARYAGEQGGDEANNDLLLDNMEAFEDRTARYVAVIAVASRGELLVSFRGEVEGQLTRERRGTNGFGYDPLFFYPPFGCTFGEADGQRKHEVSHRAAAFRRLIDWLARFAPAAG
jgi:XTP/dITP diphosphohydrolase